LQIDRVSTWLWYGKARSIIDFDSVALGVKRIHTEGVSMAYSSLYTNFLGYKKLMKVL
jgi:hypothetical protein